jgi:hypothetical protein
VAYDAAVASLAETQKLVILRNNVNSRLREVECEGNLWRAKVVDSEQDLVRQEAFIPPDSPANTSVSKAVFGTTSVNDLQSYDGLTYICARWR